MINLWIDKAFFRFTEETLSALRIKCMLVKYHVSLTKEFHCENHELLLSAVNWYGIRNIAGQWFKSYLHGRKQHVINTPDLKNVYSYWSVIKQKVLGTWSPGFSHTYINDLHPTINTPSKPVLVSNDTNIISHLKNWLFSKLHEWCLLVAWINGYKSQ
jgi:hypothetical protein